MRYITDEANHDEVSLRDEIGCLEHYLALQEMRLSQKVTLAVSLPEVDPVVRIAPMLLLPFIENVFKHGISNQQASTLQIGVYYQRGVLQLETRNPVVTHGAEAERRGIGLANARNRLEKMYAGRYKLHTHKVQNRFELTLRIEL